MSLVNGTYFTVVSPGSYDSVVKVGGEVDLLTAPRFRQTLDEVLRDRPRTVTIDMADVSFFDSSGINVLVDAFKTGRTMDVELMIHAPSTTVVRVLTLTGLDQVFHIPLEPMTPIQPQLP